MELWKAVTTKFGSKPKHSIMNGDYALVVSKKTKSIISGNEERLGGVQELSELSSSVEVTEYSFKIIGPRGGTTEILLYEEDVKQLARDIIEYKGKR